MNVHIYPTSITHESRIERMTRTLADAGTFDRIVIIGTQPGDLPATQDLDSVRSIWRIPRFSEQGESLGAKLFKTASWTARVAKRLRPERISCVTCHSLAVLPLCTRLAERHRAKLCYEPHELETETVTCRGIRKPLMRMTERRLIRRVDKIVVVGERIARWYEETYGLKRVEVFRNIPAPSPSSEPVNLRKEMGIPSEAILFVYSGGLFHGRRIAQYLRIFSELPMDRHIVFMGFGPLVPLVQDVAKRSPNIHHRPAVPPSNVVNYLRSADVGLCGVENLCMSYFLSLPNKQFEYLHAELGSLVPNFPEMSHLVRTTGAGWVVDDDSDDGWSGAILKLNPREIAQARANARNAVPHFTLAREMSRLLDTYRDMGFRGRTRR